MTHPFAIRPFAKPRYLVRSVVLALGAALAPQFATAQFGLLGSGIVFDPSNFARNVLHYARRLEQLNLQRQQFQAQLFAMRKLKSPTWREIRGTLTQMNTAMQAGQALAYSGPRIDQDFQRTFPGTTVFRNYPAEAATQASRTLATLRGALNATNFTAREAPASVARLDAIKRQLASVTGHEEALELNGTIGMYSAEELTLLRQAVAALTNVQAVYYADQVNAQAQEATTVRARLQAMSAPAPRRYEPVSLRVNP
jgi:type IV secretion system protein TrbJ